MSHALAIMRNQVFLELATRRHNESTGGSARPIGEYPVGMELRVVFEPDEQGWARATIDELRSVVTCAAAEAVAGPSALAADSRPTAAGRGRCTAARASSPHDPPRRWPD